MQKLYTPSCYVALKFCYTDQFTYRLSHADKIQRVKFMIINYQILNIIHNISLE